jgi:hypothetical protein
LEPLSARAYSSRPEDRPFVELEQAIQRGLRARAEVEQHPVALQLLDVLLAGLDDGWP